MTICRTILLVGLNRFPRAPARAAVRELKWQELCHKLRILVLIVLTQIIVHITPQEYLYWKYLGYERD